jgi:hypothetical protein
MDLAILFDPVIRAAVGEGVSDGLPDLISLLIDLDRIWPWGLWLLLGRGCAIQRIGVRQTVGWRGGILGYGH